MNAHFFDINSIITINSKVWIVSKLKPNFPLVRIDQHEFNLIKKGIWKNKGEKIQFGGTEYWIDNELAEKIKNKCKKNREDITSLCFSMQEFMNPEMIKNLDYKIWEEYLAPLKNSYDDIYLICGKNTKTNYEFLIEKLENILYDLGLQIKNCYYISETFYNRDEIEINHNKGKLLIQHAIGLKTENNKFTDIEIEKYDEIYFYDDEIEAIETVKKSNDILNYLYENSDEIIKEKVKSSIESGSTKIHVNQITFNSMNPKLTWILSIGLNKIIKTFESFMRRF